MQISTDDELSLMDAEAEVPAPSAESPAEDLVEEELLVEEISIDGMCGVY